MKKLTMSVIGMALALLAASVNIGNANAQDVPATVITVTETETTTSESSGGGGGGGSESVPTPGGGHGDGYGSPQPIGFAEAAAQRGLPIRNIGVLKAYAWHATVRGFLKIAGPSIVQGGAIITNVYVRDGNAQKVGSALSSKNFSFDFTEASMPVRMSALLLNEHYFVLFEREKQTVMEKRENGTYWLKDPWLSPALVPYPPILIPGLESARFVSNDNGAERYLRVDDNHLFYPTNLVERNGDLFLTFRAANGTLTNLVFNNSSGVVKAVKHAEGYVGVWIEGVYNFGPNPECAGAFVEGDIRDAIVQFAVIGATREIKIGGYSYSNNEAPIGFLVRGRPDSSHPWPNQFVYNAFPNNPTPTRCSIPWSFSEGEWELVYVVDLADLEGTPVSGGGGGGSSTPANPPQPAP